MVWKKSVLAVVWTLAVIGLIGLVVFYFSDPSKAQWIAAVGIVAVLTEVAFWTTAVLMGVSLWESRKKVFAWATRPFRKH